MKKLLLLIPLVLFFLLFQNQSLFSQCMVYPVALEQRISNSKFIVQGKVIDKHTYIDASNGNVNTLNKFRVNAWLKNYSSIGEIYIITLGGVYGNQATQVDPSLQLDEQHEYILMLESENKLFGDRDIRTQRPGMLQLMTYADAQGALINENNIYYDLLAETPKNEAAMLQRINSLTWEIAKKPSGEVFHARSPINFQIHRTMAVTGFSPSPTNAGTIAAGDFLTITGSGFGASPGTVSFPNANDGGATTVTPLNASDYASWADGSITVKVPRLAGTGTFSVNGAMTSPTPLTINYSHLEINNDFYNFGSTTRQSPHLVDQNTLGGYTFEYNTAFFANTPAKTAFELALLSWRCSSGVNWRVSATTTAISAAADDGTNVVSIGTLPVGVLGRATTYYSGSATVPCDQFNTVWWAEEIDVIFQTDPPYTQPVSPFTVFTWEYGPALPSGTEFDFQSVAVHELGHAHGLGHIIAPGQVMHYTLTNGATARTLSANDIAAGAAKMTFSTAALCFTPAGVTGPMTAAGCTLPIEFGTFTGKRKDNTSNQLNWTTLQEQNNKGFYIQRSANAGTFQDIGFVPGQDYSAREQSYSYSDSQAGLYPWYYRLKQVNRDGREKVSSTIYITGVGNADWKIWADESGGVIYIYGNPTLTKSARLEIFGANGQLILSKIIAPGAAEISVSKLAKGIYQYRLSQDENILSGKLLLGTN